MNKLIVIDGNSLLFRAYYATAYGPNPQIMRTKEGIPTNAIFAFGNMINTIISSFKGNEHIIVGFDAGKKTFRHEEDEDYKANRKPCPEDLLVQMGPARNLLKSLGIFVYEQEGVEGDDVCGTIAKIGSKNGYKVDVYTSDRDFLQLIDDNITINIIVKGMKDIRPINPEKMIEDYGFTPLQIIDFKGLRGDSSDNLPGIPGIGEKTATSLIQKYGSFEEIIAHADEIGGKVGTNLKEFQKQGEMCKRLATIKTDVELPFEINDLKYSGYSFKDINEFCQKFELKQFLNRIPTKFKQESEEDEQTKIEEVTKIDLTTIPNEISLSIDLDGDNYYKSNLIGIGLSYNKHHYYIVKESLCDSGVKILLENENILKNCYDFKAAKVALSKVGISLKGCGFDLLLSAYILDTTLKNEIDNIFHYFGFDIPKENSSDSLSLFDQVPNKNTERTGKIAALLPRCKKIALTQLEKVESLNLYNDIELKLADVLADMEIEGFPLNGDKLDETGKVFREKLNAISDEIYNLAGKKFNISSPKQVGEVLFTDLKIKDLRGGATSVEALSIIKNDHPIVSKILEYRKYAKLLSTYVDALKTHIQPDGKIHAMFNQAVTQTGRLSSSEPNLQNISVRDEEGKLIRKAFYYDDSSYSILSLDYSQIELRILASLSNCNALIDIFKSNEDIHTATAKKVFKAIEEVTEMQRRKAKAVNFGIVYGISDWGLADQLGIDVSESKQIISSFYESFPEVKNYLANIVLNASNDGYVKTITGRRRYLREIHDPNYQVREFAKRAAMNAPIQGTAADLIKIAMINVSKALKENGLKTKLVLQIHDELLFKVPDDEKEIAFKHIKNAMENAMTFSVPLKVTGGFGLTWYECK